ncbi:hypothetical protein V7S43_008450 [Phytophthora oleae]|uniref:Beta-lactamase-related domain-containing protein n=1 Tax=Phytophthora oleae TaxID=2107226 RepID=A0ABD3FLU8_9STRA
MRDLGMLVRVKDHQLIRRILLGWDLQAYYGGQTPASGYGGYVYMAKGLHLVVVANLSNENGGRKG